jgi:Uma2 family endonuclease
MLSRYLPKKGEHDMKNAFLFFSIKIWISSRQPQSTTKL